MQVVAAPGLKVPMEEDPRKYIDDQTPVVVENTHYYMRRLADGDLVEARGTKAVAPKAAA